MGTRADFYIGAGEQAEWLGSIAWDGYPDGIDGALLTAKSADEFKSLLAVFAQTRDDWTSHEDGWPWPWDDSQTTDYAYCLDGDRVRVFCFGREELPGDDPEEENERPKSPFPDMSERKNVTFGKRSGVIIVGS